MRLGQSSVVHFFSRIAMTAIGFLATIYLARELGASTLGTYFLVLSTVLWLSILGNLGVSGALKKRISEGTNVGEFLTAAVGLQIGFYAVIVVLIYAFRGHLEQYLGLSSVAFVVGILAAQLGYKTVRNILEGEHKVHISALLDPVKTGTRSLIQIALAILGFGVVGLLTGYLIAVLIAGGIGVLFIETRFLRPSREHVKSLYEYFQYSWLGQVKGNAFRSMDTIVLGLFVVPGLIGVYEIAWNIAVFFSIFGASVAAVLFPEISSTSTEHGLEAVETHLNQGLAFAGLFIIPGFVGSVLIGDAVLSIYGAEFVQGHHVLVILVLAQLFSVYEQQFVTVLNATDHPNLAFRINAVFLGLNLVLNLILIDRFGWTGAAIATGTSAFAGLALSYYATTLVLTVNVPKREIGYELLAATIMAAFVALGNRTLDDSVVSVIVLVGAGAATYLITLLTVSTRFRTVVRDNAPWTP